MVSKLCFNTYIITEKDFDKDGNLIEISPENRAYT